MSVLSEIPEFLAVGHVTHDHAQGDKMQLGGAALYASVTARRLGKQAAVLTSYGEDFLGREALNGVTVRVVGASRTSTFRNRYESGGRVQHVYASATSLAVGDLPSAWGRTPAVYLCPVLHEVPMEMGEAFSGSLIGVAPQGWMRKWDESGRIQGRRWEGFEALLRRSELVIVSEEDLAEDQERVQAFRRLAPIVIVTRAEQGAVIFAGRKTLWMGVFEAVERDPTGAGDCFGAAFLVRYAETQDIEEAGRFAACVGAFVVEEEGITGIPSREAVEERMRQEDVSCQWKTA